MVDEVIDELGLRKCVDTGNVSATWAITNEDLEKVVLEKYETR